MKNTSLRFACVFSLTVMAMASVPPPSRADVVVSDYDASNVLRFTDSESNVTYTGSGDPHEFVSSGSGGLEAATGITEGPDGNLYVSSQGTGQILEYNGTTGQPVDVMGNMGVFATLPTDYGGSATPAHLQFYNNYLYVSDYGGGKIERFAITRNSMGQLQAGAESDVVTGLYAAGGFTFAPNGDMYVSDVGAGEVFRILNGSSTPSVFIAPMTSPLSNPNGLLFINNNLYVADIFGNQILKYDANGNYTASTSIPPDDSSPPGNYPSDMVLSRDGQSILLAVLGPTHMGTGSVLQYDLNLDLTGTIATDLPASSSIALAYKRGDFNFDGQVDAADIQAMENALTNLSGFESTNNLSDAQLDAIADVNGDGIINNADLQALLSLLQGHGGSSTIGVPEPNAWVLACVAFGAVFHIYRRRLQK